jgi:chromosome partitioning protein
MLLTTIGNEKGGVGKSTIACNLAVEATLAGLKVLLIDSDIQQSSMDFRAIRAENNSLPQFNAAAITKNTIHKDVASFQNFDLIIIDAGGRDTEVFRSSLLACDRLLIPVLPSQYDIWATQGTIEVLEEARSFKNINASFILNQVITNTIIEKETIEALKKFQIPIFNTKLHSRVAFKKSIMEGMGVSEYESNGRAAQEIKSLWEEIANLL